MTKDNREILSYKFLLFKSGDERIFQEIFKANYNLIVGFCKQFIFDLDMSRSIAQESFLKLWLNREKVQTENGIKSFLYTAARTQCIDYLRHEKVKSSFEKRETVLLRDILESYDFNRIEFFELEEAVSRAIDNLPERCRLVFFKSRYEGKKNREIAEELGIALKSVETNITRALKSLRKNLAEFLSILITLLCSL
ncbi:RNA polymerase sigma-70 factor [Maribellus comscasis]|uniref:RNA polymerase sigma-70 factor n=1 Tax=Maribellus comscasis TaxID=2681766 RepID=A0A6I6JU27_9BACT|nr:RNA polymerase sigma-70 factor [Maribellus comscasis]QGY44769.1 RNA polymerase sigma-70 factor [Maribellus comscasis]